MCNHSSAWGLPRKTNDGRPIIPFPPADPNLSPLQQAARDLALFRANGLLTPMQLREREHRARCMEAYSEGKKNCGHCHTCGDELQKVLDGEEWCPTCGKYRRYQSHGWSGSYGESPYCVPDLPLEPPQDPRIFNRRQADGTFRPLSGFFDRARMDAEIPPAPEITEAELEAEYAAHCAREGEG